MRPTQLNQQQVNQADTKTLTHTIQISNNTPATTNHHTQQQPTMTRPRDVLPQNPNRVRDPQPQHQDTPSTKATSLKDGKRAVDTPKKQSVHTHPRTHDDHTATEPATTTESGWLTMPTRTQPGLLRKEVIQPHLPVRLPCYDFVLIASPTFDHSLRKTGWAAGFGCCQLS
jgi:hypothetical protein